MRMVGTNWAHFARIFVCVAAHLNSSMTFLFARSATFQSYTRPCRSLSNRRVGGAHPAKANCWFTKERSAQSVIESRLNAQVFQPESALGSECQGPTPPDRDLVRLPSLATVMGQHQRLLARQSPDSCQFRSFHNVLIVAQFGFEFTIQNE